MDDTLKRQFASQLQTLLDTDVTALQDLVAAQEEHAQDVARNSQVRDWSRSSSMWTRPAARQPSCWKRRQLPQLQQMLKARLKPDAFESFIVLNRKAS